MRYLRYVVYDYGDGVLAGTRSEPWVSLGEPVLKETPSFSLVHLGFSEIVVPRVTRNGGDVCGSRNRQLLVTLETTTTGIDCLDVSLTRKSFGP